MCLLKLLPEIIGVEFEHLPLRKRGRFMYSIKDMKFEERVYGISLGELIGENLVNVLLDELTSEGLSKKEALQELRIRNFGF